VFLALVAAVALLSFREWILLLARRKLAVLRESEPIWLPDYVVAESRPLQVGSLLALGLALIKNSPANPISSARNQCLPS